MNTKTILFSILLIINSKALIFAQGDTSTHQFFVHLEALIPIDTIEAYLEDLNSVEVWNHGYSGLALWQVNNYPFTMSDGTQVFDINTVIRKSTKKTQILEATYNISSGYIPPETSANNVMCFDPLNFSMSQGNQRIVKIAILDTGIDADISLSTTPDLNYNLTNYIGYDYVNGDNVPNDENGHGTHVSGIMNSITNGIDSLGNNIKFYIYKTHDSLGQAKMSNVVKALIDAVENEVDIVNMSFGLRDTFNVDSFFPLRKAIKFADDKKVMIIASAGNDSINIDNDDTILPAAFPEDNIVSVAAIHCGDSLTYFSNFGRKNADIAVLGHKIPGPDGLGGLEYLSGTSQAAAIVSAVSALLATYRNNFKPEEVKCALINGDTNLTSLTNKTLSEGKLNKSNALNLYQNQTTVYSVTNTNNSGPGSLRHAIEGVCGVETILFNSSSNGQPIQVVDKPIYMDTEISIIGNGINNTLINGMNNRAIEIGFNGIITFHNISFSNTGSNVGSVNNEGTLIISNSVKIE